MHDRSQEAVDCVHCRELPPRHSACRCLCHASRKDFVARATAFVASVADASAPTCCPWCFNLTSIEIGRSGERVTQIQRTIPKFFEVCMRLLVSYAGAAFNIPRLREVLASNQRGCSERLEMHRRRVSDKSTDPVDIFLSALFAAVRGGVSLGKRALDSDVNWYRPHFHKRSGHWPTGLADLFPCGAEAGIAALVHWCCVLPGSLSFGLLSSVLCVSRVVCMPYLLQSPLRERLLWAILQAVHPGTVAWSGAPPFRVPHGFAAPRALRGTADTVEQVLDVLQAIMCCKDTRTHEVVQLVSGYERLLADALGPHIAAFAREAPTALLVQFADLLAMLIERGASSDSNARRTPPLHLKVIGDTMALLQIARFCGNVACGANELSEERLVRFQTCEFCARVRYCSRECQKADWKVGTAGITHKMVCPMLVKLISAQHALAWDDGRHTETFTRAFEDCDFDPRDADILHRWSLARGIAPASRFSLTYPGHS